MPTHEQVQTAVELGMLSAETDTTAAAEQALRLLSRTLRSDAASLVTVDPIDHSHRQVAGVEYPSETARQLAVEFAHTQWFSDVVGSDLPPSISEEQGQSFRRGWFYEQHVAPAGFRDGMTAALRHSQRYIGLVHLSSTRAGTFDGEARCLLRAVLPALAALADTGRRMGASAESLGSSSAALVAGHLTVDLPDRARPDVLQDPAFRHLIEEFTALGGGRLRLLWPTGRCWHRVVLESTRLPGRATPAVLVRSDPAELPYDLSCREVDVLTHVAMGSSSQAIADLLFISPRTVHTHVEHILRKTSTTTRAEAAALAVREAVVRPVPGLPLHAGARHFIERAAAPPPVAPRAPSRPARRRSAPVAQL